MNEMDGFLWDVIGGDSSKSVGISFGNPLQNFLEALNFSWETMFFGNQNPDFT